MLSSTTKCNFVMLTLTVVIILISSAASQRRWAGTYPTESVDKECNCDKSDFEESKQLRPENPNYPAGGRHDEDNASGRDRINWEQPEITDDTRKLPTSGVEVDKRIEITSGEGGPVLTMIQKPHEERRPSDRSDNVNLNVRKDSYPSTGSRRNDDPRGERRVSQSSPKETVSRGSNRGIENRDPKEDPVRNYQARRENEESSKSGRDSTSLRGTRLTTSRPIESDVRTYPEARKDSRLESGRKDFERSNERSNHKPTVQSEDRRGEDSSVNTRTNPRNSPPSGGSNVNYRANLKPLSTDRNRGVAQSEDNIRKDDRSIVGSPRRDEEQGRRYGTPCNTGSTCQHEESKIPKNQNNPTRINPTRIPARPYPVTARTFPNRPNRFPQQDYPKIIPETRIEDRKISGNDGNENRNVGFQPDVSDETIIFPKDAEDDDDGGDDEYRESGYSQSGGRSFSNNQRDGRRNKRDVDLHEDVEILPGFESSNKRKEILKHYDDIDESEVDVFSPKEIKIKNQARS